MPMQGAGDWEASFRWQVRNLPNEADPPEKRYTAKKLTEELQEHYTQEEGVVFANSVIFRLEGTHEERRRLVIEVHADAFLVLLPAVESTTILDWPDLGAAVISATFVALARRELIGPRGQT
ncbi:MAG TPA: hypothetical protein DEV93_03875 [Chloroflexi bacterium]|nr:hypothetical protein [Chloroflexota bacterium]